MCLISSFEKSILIIFAKIAFVEERIFKGTYFAIPANFTFLKVVNKLFHLYDPALLMVTLQFVVHIVWLLLKLITENIDYKWKLHVGEYEEINIICKSENMKEQETDRLSLPETFSETEVKDTKASE